MKRWLAMVTYRGDHGPNVVNHEIEELDDLADLIERGPHWDTIDSILIVKPDADKCLTVEAAAKL